ncbi:response regulator [Cohnella panacarvi]|uniref:response regulator n=1 Tax=Cohnella panacarvi TaxID=400776 RepID=UPI00047E0533|nr:response regulator [Cohnella panacarvi]
MYKILVVDDEPRVCIGIRNFLLSSDMNISVVETALNGFEAIDYLRMDRYDLVLTDIQMSRMSGLELMETIYLEQPNLPVIVISAHENFEFATKSLRLGARDYLVKPVQQAELLRVVRSVLVEKEEAGKLALEQTMRKRSSDAAEAERRREILMELVTERGLSNKDYDELVAELGDQIKGPNYGIVSVRLDLSRGGFSNKAMVLQDRKLLKYAALNLFEESLSEWNGLTLGGFGNELIGIVQPNDRDLAGQGFTLQSQMHFIGQFVSNNFKQYLNLDATIGISSLRDDVALLPKLMEEAVSAAEWKKLHPEQNVFHYEDIAAQESLNMVGWMAKVEECVRRLKSDSDSERIVQDMVQALNDLGQESEQVHSYFGMLVYRVYGLLLDNGQGNGVSIRRFDPEVYFRDMSVPGKLDRLPSYVDEAGRTLRELAREREMTILARIMGYIRQHYRNPELKIQDIAAEAHFSPAYFGYWFKRETKKNVWDYVTELRIEEAKRLLVTTPKKRYEIAYEVGYESPEHFSRMFKRYAGVSPADYRKEGQGEYD